MCCQEKESPACWLGLCAEQILRVFLWFLWLRNVYIVTNEESSYDSYRWVSDGVLVSVQDLIQSCI